MFREINSYPSLPDDWVGGSPGNLNIDELHKKSWDIITPAHNKQVSNSLRVFSEKNEAGSTSDSISEIIPASFIRKIDTLFFDPDYTVWGKFDSEEQKTYIDESDTIDKDELIYFAISHTI